MTLMTGVVEGVGASIGHVQPDSRAQYVNVKVGEVVQGVDREGHAWIVTMVSTGGARRACYRLSPGLRFELHRVTGGAVAMSKTQQICERFLDDYGIDPSQSGAIHIDSMLKPGGGEASSDADKTGALLRLASAHRVPLTGTELYQRQCQIERSDLLIYPELLVQCFPEEGRFQHIGTMPNGVVLRWDACPTKSIHTHAVRGLDANRKRNAKAYAEMLQMLSGSQEDFCRAMTWSAELNNRLLPKPHFQVVREIGIDHQCGVIVSHTGTFMGLYLPVVAGQIDLDRLNFIKDVVLNAVGPIPINHFIVGGIL